MLQSSSLHPLESFFFFFGGGGGDVFGGWGGVGWGCSVCVCLGCFFGVGGEREREGGGPP